MSDEETNSGTDSLVANNYCLGFIDLLGQRDAMSGQGLLPAPENEEATEAFRATVRESIRPVRRLQNQIKTLLGGILDSPDSSFRSQLPDEQKIVWDDMQRSSVTEQRWSDGLALYNSLGDRAIKCPMNGIFAIFTTCGAACFLGLGFRAPVRGAIEVAWGIELHPNELFGPVVARAYQLESEVAQYPRIVVGPNVLAMLGSHREQSGNDVFTKMNRELAELCSQMIIVDIDGFPIIHYLGDTFREKISQDQHQEMYDDALEFVKAQLQLHQRSTNTKLAMRYSHLLTYFLAHPPSIPA